MNEVSLIRQLMSAQTGTRELDLEAAKIIGWTTQVSRVTDKSGRPIERISWMLPNADNVTGKVPDYTTNINAARQFAEAICPNHIGGCSWEPGEGTAKINDGPYIKARTPALALCIAALWAKIKKERPSN